MPVSFLTAEQERRYVRYAGEPPSSPVTSTSTMPTATSRPRSVGLTCISALPCSSAPCGSWAPSWTIRLTCWPAVAGDLARQLGIADPGCLALYREGRVRWQHAREIRVGFGYREFTDPAMRFRLARWLYALCWTGTDRPSVLFDRETAWLVTHKVLLPGATTLERLIARIRGRAARRLWRSLSQDITYEQPSPLDPPARPPLPAQWR